MKPFICFQASSCPGKDGRKYTDIPYNKQYKLSYQQVRKKTKHSSILGR